MKTGKTVTTATLAALFTMTITLSSQSHGQDKESAKKLKSDASDIQQATVPTSTSTSSAPSESSLPPAKNKSPLQDDKTCNCDLATEGKIETIEFETEKSCDPKRNYLKPMIEAFAKADPTKSYVKNRTAAEIAHSEVPRKCVTFVMRSFLEAQSQKDATDSFAICESKNGIPRQGMMKACVTSDYVNLIYNSFIDVADCLELPQKLMLPKFLNESGFHLNAFGGFRVYDKTNNAMRNLLDLRVCNSKDEKINSFADLKACSETEKKTFLDEEEALQNKIKDKSATIDDLKAFRKTKTTLRDIYDFKKADDSFFKDLTSVVTNKTSCKEKFIERFCDSDLQIVGGDSGIGQFTEPAALQAKESSAKTFAKIRKSTKASCERISKIPGVFNEIDPDISHRCDFMRSPPNPVAALVHYGSMLKAQSQNIENLWNQKSENRWSGKNIDDLMNEAKISSYDKQTIKEMLTVLAYNAGPNKPIILFGDWLLSRIQNLKKRPITKQDFDFKVPLQDEFKKMTASEANSMKLEYADLSKKKKKSVDEVKRLSQLEAMKLDHLDFSNYIRAYHTGFAKGYLKYVRDAADVLDKTFGKGVCTPKTFLEL